MTLSRSRGISSVCVRVVGGLAFLALALGDAAIPPSGDSWKRRQLGRTLAVEHCAEHGHVIQLDAVARVTQQQSAAAHVAASDERDRKSQPLAEDRRQDV